MVVVCTRCGRPGKKRSDGKERCDECIQQYRREYRASANGRRKIRQAAKRYKVGPAGRAASARQKAAYKQRLQTDAKARIASRATILRRYGMKPADYERMLAQQNGCCAICGVKQKHHLHVDHDHATGRVRALLCRGCNNGLGMFRDSIENMERAIVYVRRHSFHGEVATALRLAAC